jgi:aldehyde dehydrogenase (NAD+)
MTNPVPVTESGVKGLMTSVRNFLQTSPKKLLIGDGWVPARSGKTFETVNPATEEVLALVAEGDKADVDDAVKAARQAFEKGRWPKMGPHERARYLLKIADLIEEEADELAELETLDNGKPLWQSRTIDIPKAAETFRYYAGWCTKIYGETNPSELSTFNYTLREAVGVCGQIIPWNFPLLMAAWKIAPALACGNTVILKPAEQTPLTALRLGELILEADLPAGTVNVITGLGPGAGSSIAEHPNVDKVAFTGSTEVGKLILQASAGNLKRVSLELGGKSPNIIFEDADLKSAVPNAVRGVFYNSGQVCTARTRIFAERGIYEAFVDNFVRESEAMTVGDPFDPGTKMGPLVSKEQFEKVVNYLEVGRQEGARVATGGKPLGASKGYFVAPTVFADVDNKMRIAREEIFGPVAAVIPFKDEHDAILQANDTIYGLAASVWTGDIGRAHRVARAIKAGTVLLNCHGGSDVISPLGGYKQSGFGRELGVHSLELYTQVKSVYCKV